MRSRRKPAAKSRSGKRRIDVLVVDDSALVRQVMTTVLSQEKRIAVTVASNPIVAMEYFEGLGVYLETDRIELAANVMILVHTTFAERVAELLAVWHRSGG